MALLSKAERKEYFKVLGLGEYNKDNILNDAVGQSHTAVDVAIKLLNGEAIDNYYWVDYVKVTK